MKRVSAIGLCCWPNTHQLAKEGLRYTDFHTNVIEPTGWQKVVRRLDVLT